MVEIYCLPLIFCLFEHRQQIAGYPKLKSFGTVQLPLDLQGFQRCYKSYPKVKIRQEHTTMKYGYARVSTTGQLDGNSIEEQTNAVLAV